MLEAQLKAKTDAELRDAIEMYSRRQQEHISHDRPFLAEAAGRKANRARMILAVREAEERTRIGNTPTCDECGEQHSQDMTCDEHVEAVQSIHDEVARRSEMQSETARAIRAGFEDSGPACPNDGDRPRITAGPRGNDVYVDRITDGDGITRTLSTPIRLL